MLHTRSHPERCVVIVDSTEIIMSGDQASKFPSKWAGASGELDIALGLDRNCAVGATPEGFTGESTDCWHPPAQHSHHHHHHHPVHHNHHHHNHPRHRFERSWEARGCSPPPGGVAGVLLRRPFQLALLSSLLFLLWAPALILPPPPGGNGSGSGRGGGGNGAVSYGIPDAAAGSNSKPEWATRRLSVDGTHLNSDTTSPAASAADMASRLSLPSPSPPPSPTPSPAPLSPVSQPPFTATPSPSPNLPQFVLMHKLQSPPPAQPTGAALTPLLFETPWSSRPPPLPTLSSSSLPPPPPTPVPPSTPPPLPPPPLSPTPPSPMPPSPPPPSPLPQSPPPPSPFPPSPPPPSPLPLSPPPPSPLPPSPPPPSPLPQLPRPSLPVPLSPIPLSLPPPSSLPSSTFPTSSPRRPSPSFRLTPSMPLLPPLPLPPPSSSLSPPSIHPSQPQSPFLQLLLIGPSATFTNPAPFSPLLMSSPSQAPPVPSTLLTPRPPQFQPSPPSPPSPPMPAQVPSTLKPLPSTPLTRPLPPVPDQSPPSSRLPSPKPPSSQPANAPPQAPERPRQPPSSRPFPPPTPPPPEQRPPLKPPSPVPRPLPPSQPPSPRPPRSLLPQPPPSIFITGSSPSRSASGPSMYDEELVLSPQQPEMENALEPPSQDLAPVHQPQPPQPQPAGFGDGFMGCRVNSDGIIFADNEKFPYGLFHSDVCSCNASPYTLRFGPELRLRDGTYYTFRLYPKPCNSSIVIDGQPVCSTIRKVLNKIAFRLEPTSNICFDNTSATVDKAAFWKGVRFRRDSTMEPGPWLQARAGYSNSRRHIEMYIYGLKKGDYTAGTFLMLKCPERGSFANICRRSADGRCLYSFVDTPGHRFVTVCRAQGLTSS